MSTRRKLLAITTGDTDGIGLEVSTKALALQGRNRDVVFCLFRGTQTSRADRQRLDSFRRRAVIPWIEGTLSSLHKKMLAIPWDKVDLVEIVSEVSPAIWVQIAGTLCHRGIFCGIVTAPLSKTEISRAGIRSIGHTQILEKVTRTKPAFMGFIGDHFSVVLGSGHVPLHQAGKIFLKDLDLSIAAAQELRRLLPKAKRHLPIAVLGVNPHAGESGMIGKEDLVLREKLRQRKIAGPLVPDVAFMPENWKKYSVFLAAAHDQGLIPFKMIHGFHSGIHVTLGLPIRRSSVDHGTAKDIFAKNKADAGSMHRALKWSVDIAKQEGTKRV